MFRNFNSALVDVPSAKLGVGFPHLRDSLAGSFCVRIIESDLARNRISLRDECIHTGSLFTNRARTQTNLYGVLPSASAVGHGTPINESRFKSGDHGDHSNIPATPAAQASDKQRPKPDFQEFSRSRL